MARETSSISLLIRTDLPALLTYVYRTTWDIQNQQRRPVDARSSSLPVIGNHRDGTPHPYDMEEREEETAAQHQYRE